MVNIGHRCIFHRGVEINRLCIGKTKFVLLQGDITLQDTVAIVNAANSSLMGGEQGRGAI